MSSFAPTLEMLIKMNQRINDMREGLKAQLLLLDEFQKSFLGPVPTVVELPPLPNTLDSAIVKFKSIIAADLYKESRGIQALIGLTKMNSAQFGSNKSKYQIEGRKVYDLGPTKNTSRIVATTSASQQGQLDLSWPSDFNQLFNEEKCCVLAAGTPHRKVIVDVLDNLARALVKELLPLGVSNHIYAWEIDVEAILSPTVIPGNVLKFTLTAYAIL